jgi:hypothetical protein
LAIVHQRNPPFYTSKLFLDHGLCDQSRNRSFLKSRLESGIGHLSVPVFGQCFQHEYLYLRVQRL